jgi:hypothetical protein
MRCPISNPVVLRIRIPHECPNSPGLKRITFGVDASEISEVAREALLSELAREALLIA